MHRMLALAASLLALPANALTLDLVLVGNAGNTPDSASNCLGPSCGSVPQNYFIGRTEITNAQYAEFLNAVAEADPNGLYHASMGSSARGGITRSGGAGNYSYAVKGGQGDEPVVFVSLHDALRFANWLHNGQPTGAQGAGTTEGGAYTITPGGIAANSIARNGGASFFVPNENEWYKAAYYDPGLDLYYNSPTSTDLSTHSGPPPGDSNTANVWEGTYALTGSASFDDGFDYLTPVGAYATATSPYGTFDQAGNVWEWNELADGSFRGLRGGGWNDNPGYVSAGIALSDDPTLEGDDVGFRVAAVPEPGQLALAAVGAAVLAASRRRRADSASDRKRK
jgi:formylglycine-generating enzyme required for sulfatase activity